MLIAILFSIVGVLVGHLHVRNLSEMKLIDQKFVQQLRDQQFFVFLVFIFIAKLSVGVGFLILSGLCLSGPLLIFCNLKQRKTNYEEEILLFLDQVILQLNMGQSFRESLATVIMPVSIWRSSDLRQVVDCVLYPGENSKPRILLPAQELLKNFQSLDQSQFRVTERVLFLRDQEKSIRSFRRKSRTATQQATGQALVVALLYLVLFVWTLNRDLDVLTKPYFIVSAVCFLTGISLIFWIPRRFRWSN